MIFAFVCFFVVSIFGEESKLHFCDGSGLFFFLFFFISILDCLLFGNCLKGCGICY
jgi:hypothetical protein